LSGTLPPWLEKYFGVDADAPGEGTLWRLVHSWPWEAWVTLLAVAAMIALVATVYALEIGPAGRIRRIVLATLRLSSIGLVLMMIAAWVLELNPTQLPYLVVLVDDSESMKIADHYDKDSLRAEIVRRIKATGFDSLTRLNQAKTLLLEDDAVLLRSLDSRYKLRVYFCSEAARLQSGNVDQIRDAIRRLQPTGKATRLGDCLRSVLNDQGLSGIAAVVLLTDGITTDGQRLVGQAASRGDSSAADSLIAEGGAADIARAKGVPIFAVGLGSDSPLQDLELADLQVSDVAFIDDMLTFRFNLIATGYAGKQVEVRLKDKKSGTALARQTVTISGNHKPQELTLSHRPDKVGQFDYVVEVDRLPDEVRDDNNQLERQVSVRKAQIRVLLVQAYPNYEFRYLKNLLQRDTTIELHSLLQDADVEYASADKTALAVFPVRREDLFAYDVVIFGDVNPALLSTTALSNLSDFVVQKGGGLVLVAGPAYNPLAYRGTPLAPLIPVDLATALAPDPQRAITDGFTMRPTTEGLNEPNMQLGDTPAETVQIWQKLPPLYWLLETQPKESAEVLAEHPTRRGPDGRPLPVILQRRAGAGMVLFHATDETWRWRYQVGDVFFARYWIQTIRYLSRTKLLGKDQAARLSTNRKQYAQGEPVRLRLEFTDPRLSPADGRDVTILLRRGDQAERQLKLTRSPTNHELFEATLDPLPEGSYQALVVDPPLPGQPEASFQVKVSEVEFERTQMDVSELQGAADKTKGHFYTWQTAGTLLDDLPAGRHVPMRPTSPPVELWNRWPVLLLVLLLLVAEWTLRKRSGMI
jgi:uncharacterized membrane protein